MIIFLCIASLLLTIPFASNAQSHESGSKFNEKRFAWVAGSEAVCYGLTMIGLNDLWYSNYARSPFHLFNDNDEWFQMDKMGHFMASYYVGLAEIRLMNSCGVKRTKSIFIGGAVGLIFLTSVEVLDGFSKAWGASLGDISANTAGYVLVASQQYLWDDQRIQLKYSMFPSKYAKYRPDMLGENILQQSIKDYNAMNIWLSFNMASLTGSSRIPTWLNIALGYGAEGMIGANANPTSDNNGNPNPVFIRYRQYYFSLDVDLSKVKTKSPFLHTLFQCLGFIKFPFPALEFNDRHGLTARAMVF